MVKIEGLTLATLDRDRPQEALSQMKKPAYSLHWQPDIELLIKEDIQHIIHDLNYVDQVNTVASLISLR